MSMDDAPETTPEGWETNSGVADRGRDEALYQALVRDPQRRQAKKARDILKDQKSTTLKPVRAKLKSALKVRMRTVEHYLCDDCDTLINQPSDGFVIRGNVYVADPSVLGGLIGDNIPEPDAAGMISPDAIRQTVLCKKCFFAAIGAMSNHPKASRSNIPRLLSAEF
jgi:hypothetical protein